MCPGPDHSLASDSRGGVALSADTPHRTQRSKRPERETGELCDTPSARKGGKSSPTRLLKSVGTSSTPMESKMYRVPTLPKLSASKLRHTPPEGRRVAHIQRRRQGVQQDRDRPEQTLLHGMRAREAHVGQQSEGLHLEVVDFPKPLLTNRSPRRPAKH